jgi:hypothetical protein
VLRRSPLRARPVVLAGRLRLPPWPCPMPERVLRVVRNVRSGPVRGADPARVRRIRGTLLLQRDVLQRGVSGGSGSHVLCPERAGRTVSHR